MSTNIHFETLALSLLAQIDSPLAPPACLVGRAGVGKNKGGVELAAKLCGLNYVYIPVPRHDPAEFNGYPYVCNETKSMRFYAPHWAVQVEKNGPENFILFFDEASDGTRMTQAAMHGVLTDGIIGEVCVKGAPMVMAMNPSNIATTGGTVSHPFRTRTFTIEWEPDKHDWIRQIRQGSWDASEVKQLPKGWTDTIPASQAMVGNFLSKFPQHVEISERELMERGEDADKPAHTRRTWEHFWTLRAAAHASGQTHLMHMIAEGTVGAPGIEYLSWEKDLEFGDPELWLNAPQHQTFPDDDDRVFAVINAVLACVLQNNTPDRWAKGWEFLEFCYDKNFGDLASLGATMLAKNRGKAKGIPSAAKKFFPMLKAAGLMGGE
ncbi:MAG: putative sliding-clamp-loader subunit [Prokaryotic dsDNA virus sp.]|mgnify:FL=1|nr:MAG: putative sliding-clamp-loader subunit [Prokaryotic dsDNA virus sp.]|tara:strand:+ start:798 stop:1934 length:1137 start_codon:yes stop_codon:yes gene_type:complete